MSLEESIEFERTCVGRAMVAPHWLPGNNVFWYRRALPSDKWQFISVNCAEGIAQPAFDHETLAHKLSSDDGDGGESLDPEKLLLTSLNVDPDGLWVRFQYSGKTWQFSKDQTLEHWHGEFNAECFEQDYDISRPSLKTSPGQSQVTIVNLTASTLGYYWIDYDGNAERRIDHVLAGDSFLFISPIGHRFRFWEGSTGRNVVLELKQKRGIVNIEDRPEGLGISWEASTSCELDSDTLDSARDVTKPEYETFIRQHNLWTRKDGTEAQVSFNGFEDDRYQLASVTPDGRYAVAMQTRSGSKYPLELRNSVPDGQFRPTTLSHSTRNGRGWWRAGDHIDTDRPRLFDLHVRREIPTDDSLFRNPYEIKRIGWSRCGRKFRFIFNERGHKHVRLLEISLDGTVKVLVEDSSDTVIDYNQKLWYKLMPMENEVFWASERDGWNHIYRFDLDGSLKNQVTKGEWVVKSVEYVDPKEQRIWFTACGMISDQDPYYAHLACVNFDGSGLRLVTKEDGTHLWKFSPDRRFIIDFWSRVDLLPHVAVVDVSTSKQTVFLHKEVLSLDLAGRYAMPERFIAKGRDNETDIYGVIFHPPALDEKKKYPIIELIYAHPFQFYTPKGFQKFSGFRKFAEDGYIIVAIDGMGTNGRSKAFRDVSYKNLNDAGFPDRIKWMQAAARTRPWMDTSRVGVIGGSAGGQNAAAALLHYNDFYKAAVAESGSHDNRMSDYKWAEMFLSWPIDASYETNSNCVNAGKLSGALLLVTGEVDNVVDPATTMRFASALIEANKDFDLVVVPKVGHFTAGSDWLQRKRAQFFKRHLQA